MSEAGGRNGNRGDNQLRLESINRANSGARTNQGILVERFIRSRDAEFSSLVLEAAKLSS